MCATCVAVVVLQQDEQTLTWCVCVCVNEQTLTQGRGGCKCGSDLLSTDATLGCSSCIFPHRPLKRPLSGLPSSLQMSISCPTVTFGFSFIRNSVGGLAEAALNPCSVEDVREREWM